MKKPIVEPTQEELEEQKAQIDAIFPPKDPSYTDLYHKRVEFGEETMDITLRENKDIYQLVLSRDGKVVDIQTATSFQGLEAILGTMEAKLTHVYERVTPDPIDRVLLKFGYKKLKAD